MPELARFFGIVIMIYYYDNQRHNVPHIHARYGEQEAEFDLDGNMIRGNLDPKQKHQVENFINAFPDELKEAWNCAVNGSRA